MRGTSDTIERSTICTLYEGDYHYGVGALTNSLYHQRFSGDIWVGYRAPLPPWAHPVEQTDSTLTYRVGEGLVLRFVPLDTRTFLSNYKPHCALRVLDEFAPGTDAVFYFDPDIVIKCDWLFYETWAARGFACCEDNCYPHMPSTHPLRLAWLDFAARHALATHRKLDAYYNAGFFGVTRGRRAMLETWGPDRASPSGGQIARAAIGAADAAGDHFATIALCQRDVPLRARLCKERLQGCDMGWKRIGALAHANQRIRFARRCDQLMHR